MNEDRKEKAAFHKRRRGERPAFWQLSRMKNEKLTSCLGGQPEHGAKAEVLGGSSGIGLATAAAADGAFVMIASRSQAKLDAGLTRLAGNTRAVVLDTSDEAAVERFFTDEAPWDHVVVLAAKPAELPVQLPVKFEMAKNLKTAKALGLG
jgi:hypothetical protein